MDMDNTVDTTILRSQQQNIAGETSVDTTNHKRRRDALVMHFNKALLFGEVVWPRENKKSHMYNPLVSHV